MYSRRGWSYSSGPTLGSGSRRRRRGRFRPSFSFLFIYGPFPYALLLVALAAWYQFAFAGFTLDGSVSDSDTGAAIMSARVWSGASEATSGPDGHFQIQGVKPPEAIGVEARGYVGHDLRPLSANEPLAATLHALPTDVPPTLVPQPTAVPTPDRRPQPADLLSAGMVNPISRAGEVGGTLLPDRRIVAFYGNPLAAVMGVLGQAPEQETVQRLQAQAQAYAEADPSRPVQAALELVTPTAQFSAGQDGLYRYRMPPEVIDQMAGWAERYNLLLILDVQIGQSNVPDEVRALEPYLSRPYVHLALDPEFAMADKLHVPGTVIGTMDASDVNWTIDYLAALAASKHLPPKMLILHRFLESMLTNREEIHPSPAVQVVVDMDGFGPPVVKEVKYQDLVRDEAIQFSGVKLFYQHDVPLWTPQDVLALSPAPDIVIYQ